MSIKIINVVGARPNFMKIAPIHNLMLKSKEIEPILLHTGQHYDQRMSKIFFDDLEMPKPDIYLGIGSGSHAVQTAKIMIEFEQVLLEQKPDLVLVVGDVNSTLACSVVASKMGVKIAHVESGLRSFDRRMPEELNRIVTDNLADYLFVSENSGLINLKKEGIDDSKVFFCGNVMIDSLVNNLEKANKCNILEELGLEENKYILTTLHRPSNVDSPKNAQTLVDTLLSAAQRLKVVFPIHPRTKKQLVKFNMYSILENDMNIILIEPAGYIDFLALMKNSALLLTDSGGIQEETTYLSKPCLTLRENTERPVTITEGTNILLKELNEELIISNIDKIISGNIKQGTIPKYWDGQTAKRIIEIIKDKLK